MELLVVVAIIGILANLLLPAVQQARESARRISCANNLKQVSLAIQNYETANKRLPAAGTYADPIEAVYFKYAYRRVDLKSGTNYGWVVAILPYLEQQPLYDQFDLTIPVTRNPLDPQATQIATLLCPSDETGSRFFNMSDSASGRPVPFAKANYAAYTNPFHVDAWFHPGAIWLYGIGMQRVTDGTSSTLALAEIRTRENASDQRGAWALPWSGSSLLSFDMHPSLGYPLLADNEVADPYIPNPASSGFTQMPNGRHPDVLYECPELKSALIEEMPCNTEWQGYISAAPRSLHPGGVNVAFLDGHVTFLPDEVDEYSMAYMVNPSDDAVIKERY